MSNVVVPLRTPRRKARNPRVRPVEAYPWAKLRMKKISKAVYWASRAKAARTALGVTQREMARAYQVTPATIGRWESGLAFVWDRVDLAHYSRVALRVAARPYRRGR